MRGSCRRLGWSPLLFRMRRERGTRTSVSRTRGSVSRRCHADGRASYRVTGGATKGAARAPSRRRLNGAAVSRPVAWRPDSSATARMSSRPAWLRQVQIEARRQRLRAMLLGRECAQRDRRHVPELGVEAPHAPDQAVPVLIGHADVTDLHVGPHPGQSANASGTDMATLTVAPQRSSVLNKSFRKARTSSGSRRSLRGGERGDVREHQGHQLSWFDMVLRSCRSYRSYQYRSSSHGCRSSNYRTSTQTERWPRSCCYSRRTACVWPVAALLARSRLPVGGLTRGERFVRAEASNVLDPVHGVSSRLVSQLGRVSCDVCIDSSASDPGIDFPGRALRARRKSPRLSSS
jgi:hypothetical protein